MDLKQSQPITHHPFLSSDSVFLIGYITKAGPIRMKERFIFHALGVVFPSTIRWLRTKKHIDPIAPEGRVQSRGTPEYISIIARKWNREME